jgi:hypothetical protein
MAYRKEKQRVLSGSLNLLLPPDKLPDGDMVRCQNWRMDQAGQLQSRKGLVPLSAALGAEIHSMFRFGNDRYAGVGTTLRYGGTLSTTLESGFDGEPLGFAAYQGFTWVMNQNKQVKVKPGVSHNMSIEAPTAAGGEIVAAAGPAGTLTGDFTWYVTYDNDYGHESNPSPASNEVTLSAQQVTLSNIPTSSDPQVTKRHVYGVGGGLSAPLRFITIHDNTTTSVTVTATVDDAQTLNQAMPTDADPAPPAAGMIGQFFSKLIAWDTEDHVNRLYWSNTAQPWAWPGSDDEFEGNWIDVGDENEKILNCTIHARMLVIYKERSIWRLPGDPDEVDPEKSAADVGLVGRRAVCSSGVLDYFVAPDAGAYSFNGDLAQKISVQVDPVFNKDWSEVGEDVSIPPISEAYKHLTSVEHVNGRVYISYADETAGIDGEDIPNLMLVYDTDARRWGHLKSSWGGFTALYYEGPSYEFVGGINGRLYEIGEGLKDFGLAIHAIAQTGYLDQRLPDNPKIYSDLVVVNRTAEGAEAPPSDITVKVAYDNGTFETVGTLNSSERTESRWKLGSDGKGRRALNAAVLIEGDCTTTVTIFDVYLHYYVEARYAKSFDSGVVRLAGDLVGEIEEVEADVTAPGVLAFSLDTDLPGNTLTSRETFNWMGNGSRQTLHHTFADRPVGHRGRFFLGSDENFQLHGIRYKVLPIGVYIDGAAGEVWEPEPVG